MHDITGMKLLHSQLRNVPRGGGQNESIVSSYVLCSKF